MEIYTVSFFGHRDFSEHLKYEDKIKQLILKLLREKEYVEFLVGRNGEFDLFVSSVIRRTKNEYGYDNCSLTLVLPYMTAEFESNEKYFLAYYDNVEICPKSQITHFKSAITVRNKSIVDRCDLVVFYVKKNSGGAYEAMKYAKKTVGNMPKHTLDRDYFKFAGMPELYFIER